MQTVEMDISPARIGEVCQRHHIQRLWVFGSALRPDFGPGSDVDLLVEFEPGRTPGWEIVDVEDDFSHLFGGRRVDLVNPRYLNPRVKDRILGSAVLRYEAPDAA